MERRNVTKEDLAALLSEKTGDSIVHSKEMIDGLMDVVMDCLDKGRNIQLRDFCSLKVVERKEKMAHNFKTGENVVIPAHNVIKFVPGKVLKERVK